MFTYKIPSILPQELEEYKALIKEYKAGNIGNIEFKAKRVPMGIYEQRVDGVYMIRVRCAGGFITPTQFKGLAEVSAQYNLPYVHITTRQEIQIHNIKSLEDTYEISKKLLDVGLISRGGGGNTVRNVMTDLESGTAKDDVFDVTPYAVALTNQLISEPDSWTLPRKFKISFSSSSEDRGYAAFNDLGFIAKVKDGKRGFKVYAGGGLAVKPMVGEVIVDFMPEEDLLYVAKAVKQMFSKYGNRRNRHKARLRFVFYKLGKEKVLELFNEFYQKVKTEESLQYTIPKYQPTQANISIRPEKAKSGDFTLWKERYTKEQKQQGYYTVMLPFEHGNIDPATVIDLATFLENFGDDVIRFSMRQNIQLRNIPEAYLGNLYNYFKEINPDTDKAYIVNSLVSCTGADTCRLGICLSKGVLSSLRKELHESDLNLDAINDFRVNISGCPNSCGQHRSAHLGFFGKVGRNERMYPEYNIVVVGEHKEGKTKLAENRSTISAKDLPRFTLDLLKDFIDNREKYNNSFNEYAEAEGLQKIDNLTEQYNKAIPSWEENKDYYYDWGSDEPFSLAGRTKGECSAGVFDMIDVDMNSIKQYKDQLNEAQTSEAINELLEKTVFSTARMLLVTRGIDPKSEQEVYKGFITAFIDDELIPAKYKPLVESVRNNEISNLSEKTDEIFELSRTVIELYESMDDSLQFTKTKKQDKITKQEEDTDIKLRKDYRGVACPMNFVKTKLDLATLDKGDILEIWLDDGEPIQNVPGSVRSEGHKVLEERKTNEGYWVVIIEKTL